MAASSDDDLLDDLVDVASTKWPELLAARFPGDDAAARQALVWLRAARSDREVPDLGGGAARYTLEELVGKGATAEVWRAYDGKLGRHVALKLFHAGGAGIALRSLAEARASSEVMSEHVVRVHDVHVADPPYIVMELVAERAPESGELELGASAADLRPRDVREAVRWLRDLARGVHDAHLHDVFHRDLKPHNVLVAPISRRAKIADFGLAIGASSTGGEPDRRLVGTPAYMAPEQARGLPPLDPRDPHDRRALVALDVWGIGAIAYDLLYGVAPWQPRGDATAWELALVGEIAMFPRSRAGETLPRSLRRVLAKTLASDPGARYASARALAEELDAILDHRPTSFDRAAPARIALWGRRNPQLAITALAAALLAGVSVATYATVLGLRDERHSLAEENRAVLAEKARLSVRIGQVRAELADTEKTLAARSGSLADLRATLATTRTEYEGTLAAKARAVDSADLASRRLASSLADAQTELDVADRTRDLYEGFWKLAREEAAQAKSDRDDAVRARDASKADRDHLAAERDAAVAARTRAESERDAARSDRDREHELREKQLQQCTADPAVVPGGAPEHERHHTDQ